jgi:flagellar hook assembly protein FlgD
MHQRHVVSTNESHVWEITMPGGDGTAVEESRVATVPEEFSLAQNYPNPFNSSTVIRFDLPSSGMVQLVLYNLAGQQIATLAQGARQAGTHTLHWDGRDDDGRDLASGLYLYRLQAGGQMQMRKLVLIR